MSKVRFILTFGLLALIGLALMAGCRSAHTTSAILYIDEQNYNKAVQVIHEGFEYSDNEPDAYYYLGEAHSHLAEEAVENDDYAEAMKNYKLAWDAYQRTLELDREDWQEDVDNSLKYNYSNRMRQAQLDWQESYFEQAEGHFRLAYAADPDSLTPIKSIARMKMQMSQDPEYQDERDALLGEALNLLDQVLEANPSAYELQLDKAGVLAALKRNDEANAIYTKLLAEHGDDTDLLAQIATLALDEGDIEKAADFYVRIVDLHESDTDASNDDQNKEMLVNAGAWYASRKVGRFEDAISALDRAANLELVPTENTMLTRLITYFNYGNQEKRDAAEETDPAKKADLEAKAKSLFERAVEIGVAMTNNFVANPDGFLYLSMAQFELGDYAAATANDKTYQELKGQSGSGTP